MVPVINLEKTGTNIKKLRKERGLTIRKLQEYFPFTNPQPIYKWEYGAHLPTVDNLVILAYALGVRIEDILVIEEVE